MIAKPKHKRAYRLIERMTGRDPRQIFHSISMLSLVARMTEITLSTT